MFNNKKRAERAIGIRNVQKFGLRPHEKEYDRIIHQTNEEQLTGAEYQAGGRMNGRVAYRCENNAEGRTACQNYDSIVDSGITYYQACGYPSGSEASYPAVGLVPYQNDNPAVNNPNGRLSRSSRMSQSSRPVYSVGGGPEFLEKYIIMDKKSENTIDYSKLPESFTEGERPVQYEKVGIFGRFLNIIALLCGVGILALGIFEILGNYGVASNPAIIVFGISVGKFSIVLSLTLQILAFSIWLLSYERPGKIGALAFIAFSAIYHVFLLAPGLAGGGTAESVLLLIFNIGVSLSLGFICIAEKYLRKISWLAVFLLVANIAVMIVGYIIAGGYISLPVSVDLTSIQNIIQLVSIILFSFSFLLSNTFWQKRKLPRPKIIIKR